MVNKNQFIITEFEFCMLFMTSSTLKFSSVLEIIKSIIQDSDVKMTAVLLTARGH